MAELVVPPGIIALCRWCGGEAIPSPYATTWTCLRCCYHVAECRCDRRTPPMAPEQTAIVPLQPWARTVIALVIAVLLSGCSGLLVSVSDEPPMCLPPGITALPSPSSITGGESVRTPFGPGILLHYQRGREAVDIVWVQGAPIAIDPDAADPMVPVWIKSPEAACRWHQEWVGGERA